MNEEWWYHVTGDEEMTGPFDTPEAAMTAANERAMDGDLRLIRVNGWDTAIVASTDVKDILDD